MLAVLATVASGGTRVRHARPTVSAIAAGVGAAVYQLAFFAGLARTGVAVGTVVAMGMVPAFAGAIALAVRGERPNGRWALGTAVAIVGVAVLVLSGSKIGVDPMGVLFSLVAAASFAVCTIGSKGLLEAGRGPIEAMAVAYGMGALLLAPVLMVGDLGWLAQPSGLLMALYLAIGPTVLAYVLFATGLARLRPATVATLTLADPLSATVLGIVLLGERPSVVAVFGSGLVLSGLVLVAGKCEGGKGRTDAVVANKETEARTEIAALSRVAA
jgi:DME family drug/metabolite transporter